MTRQKQCWCIQQKAWEECRQFFIGLYRKRVCRGKFREKERPVLLNSWEGMYFAISEEKMLELADTAVEAGIELLVMDDGWFRGRNSDTTSWEIG